MNYQKIYNQIIERAQIRQLEGYSEKHHIIPKCLGGNNKKENLVKLTAREHFLCHWLLFRIYQANQGLAYSFWIMSNRYLKDKKQSSRSYQEAKEAFSKLRKGQKHSEMAKEKLRNNKERGMKISISLKGSKRTELTKNNQSLARLGKKESLETRQRKSKTLTGMKKSKEHVLNISKAKTGKGNHMFGVKGKNNKRSISTNQYDLEGNFIKEWENSLIASKQLDINYHCINNCCLGKQKTAGGFKWGYLIP